MQCNKEKRQVLPLGRPAAGGNTPRLTQPESSFGEKRLGGKDWALAQFAQGGCGVPCLEILRSSLEIVLGSQL